MSPGPLPFLTPLLLAAAVTATACGTVFMKDYEYEEELYLAVDGTVTVNVNASLVALVALRGADVDPAPLARPDRERVRALFAGPDVRVKVPTFSRRHGRPFVHVSLEAADVRQLRRLAPFAWSTYRFEQKGDALTFRQVVGRPSGQIPDGFRWNGDEFVGFRLHVPSKIVYKNTSTNVRRGNIVAWEQPLSDRLAGAPIDMQVDMEPESILYTTLLLFAGTVVAAAVSFGLVIWWVARRGRNQNIDDLRSMI